MVRLLALAAPIVLALPVPADAALSRAELEELRAVDARLAAIGHRLVTANAALCTTRAPATGIVLHALQQYAPDERATARTVFGFATPFAVETVVPGSAAAQAGVRANDGLVAVNGVALPDAPASGGASSASRDQALATIAAAPAGPLRLTVLRDGQRRELTLNPPLACPTRFEVLLGAGLDAQSDGKVVQLGVRWLTEHDDDAIAAIAAHEFAHAVLLHRERLEKAGVATGLLAEFGRDRRLTRKIEDQADQLSVALLYNAGFDPALAVRFWQGPGLRVDGGILRSRTHASAAARARAITAEIATIPPGAPRPWTPPVLATREGALE